MSALERLLRHDRVVVAAGLVVLTLLAWVYVVGGAGMGMSAREMTRLALLPHPGGVSMQGGSMTHTVGWTTVVAMWWVMMIAMMVPSVAPFVLLYGRVRRHSAGRSPAGVAVASSMFLAVGYLVVWLLFSVAASAAQIELQRVGLVSSTMLGSTSPVLSAAILLGAGVYQLTPAKGSCLRHCRSPVSFLTRHWRPGRLGAFRMGLEHGSFCVGCCWLLMALLFVGGVMNLAWIALLTLFVLAEKVAPRGMVVSRVAGVVLLAWGVVALAS